MTSRLLTFQETAAWLTKGEIQVSPWRLAHTKAEAARAALELGCPVALKALSPAQTHKTEAGLVRLNLSSAHAVSAACHDLRNCARDLPLDGILVQKMAPPGVEMLLGIHRDPQFGLVLAIGAGGALVELLDDVALGLLPLTQGEIGDMLAQTRADQLLAGFRGQPPADRPALIALIERCCRWAANSPLKVESLDLNPVIVHPAGQGVSLVDARVFVDEEKLP